MRTFSRLLLSLALLACIGLISELAKAKTRTKNADRQKVSDLVARPLTPSVSDLAFDESALQDRFSLFGSPYQKALESVLAPQQGCLLPQQALIIHFATWGAFGAAGPFALNTSNWYVYHASRKSARLAAVGVKKGQKTSKCDLKQARLKSDDTALLYGDRSAILMTVDIFTPQKAAATQLRSAIASPLPLVYKVSVTPTTAANVQNLNMLVGALLGLKPEVPGKEAEAKSVTYLAITKIDGYKSLPFTFNIAFSFNIPKEGPVGDSKPPNPHPQGGTPAPPPLPSPTHPVDQGTTASAAPPVAPVVSGQNTSTAPAASNPHDASSDGSQKQDGQSPSTDTSNKGSPTVVDCTAVSSQSPCTFNHSFKSDDKEWWDVSVGVSIPGVREPNYSGNASKPPTVTRHTDLYAIFDLLPFAKCCAKDSFAPRLNVGLPIAGKTFYRPYFGISENITGRWRSFPVQLNVFAGVVYLKQSISVPSAAGAPPVLGTDRVIKGLYGMEVPVSSIVSKITGGKSK